MTDKPSLELLEGAGEVSKRRRRWSRLIDEKLKDWCCPLCIKEDGEHHNEVAMTFRGAVVEGKFIRLKGAVKGRMLLCTRCVKKGRKGMHGHIGAVALWEPRLGWQWLYNADNS